MSFFRRYKERIIVTLVIVILISIMAGTSGGRKSISKLEKVTGNILSPLLHGANKGGKKVSNSFGDVKNIFTLKEKNEELSKKVAKLEDENRKYQDVIGKSDYLRYEYELLKTTSYNLTRAEIIGREGGNWFNRFTINKGTKDGIKNGDIIVQAVEVEQGVVIEGLVGRVIDIGDNWSKVVTIIDELSNISFKVIRTQDGGIVSGDVNMELSGYVFDDKADVVKGDRLYTSGLGGKFKKDLYIGDIDEVINDNEDMVKSVKIKPAIDFKKIYTVYVLSE